MADKEKTYTSHPITIDSQEYRDLIIEAEESKHEADDYRHRWYEEQKKREQAEKDLATEKAECAKLTAFLSSSSEAKALFEAYLAKEALKAVGKTI